MSKQSSGAAKISREALWEPRVKLDFQVISLSTEFNPSLPDLNELIRNRIVLLYSDPKIKVDFTVIKTIYERGKNLKETLSPLLFPSTENLIVGLISTYSKRCDICANFMVFDNIFRWNWYL